jgi:predicted  nucleic acid-binding Zn-ribbon protein
VNTPRLLHQLQEIDLAIEAAQEKTARIQAELAADALAAERAAIEAQRSKLKSLSHELREATAQVDDFSSRIKLHEEKLYSGRVTSPKELSTLQKDIELLKGHRAPHEDRSLELMESIETAEAGIAAAEIALQRHGEALEIHRKKLAGELKNLGDQLSDLESRRAALVSEIPADVQAQYQFLRKQKGRAVVKIEQGVCRGCGIAVTAAWLHRARAGEAVHCTSCNRILYLE